LRSVITPPEKSGTTMSGRSSFGDWPWRLSTSTMPGVRVQSLC
jgi:hypothetical protein